MEPTIPYVGRPSLHALPTPNLADRIYSVSCDARSGTYQLPAPGTAWSRPDHNGKLTGFVFATALPDKEKPGFLTEYWINARSNQDAHNFEIEYPYADTNYPRLTRTYVFLRAGLTEPAAGSADPVHADLKLVAHSQINLEDPILNALFVGVRRTYEKIPGPSQAGQKIGGDHRLRFAKDGETTTTTQTVAYGTEPSDGPLVISSNVQPASSIEATITTVTATGWVPLVGTLSYVLGTKGTVTETYDPSGEQTADTGLLIAESSVAGYADGSSVKRTVSVAAHPTLTGSRWDDELKTSIVYTETRVAPANATPGPGVTITPENKDRSVVRTETVDADAIAAYLLAYPSRTNLQIPDVLESIKVYWTKESKEGAFVSDYDGAASGTSYSLSGSESGNAQSSACLIPEIEPVIRQVWSSNVPTTTYFFYLPDDTADVEAAILAKFSASKWPVFKPRSISLVLRGMKATITAQVSAAGARGVGTNGDSWDKTEGEGESYDINSTIRRITIPPTIHGALSLTGTTEDSVEITAAAEVGWSGPHNFPTVSATASATETVSGKVEPTSFSATSPSTYPTSGNYLVDCKVSPGRLGWLRCMAEIFDASNLA